MNTAHLSKSLHRSLLARRSILAGGALVAGLLASHTAIADADYGYWDGTGTRPAKLEAETHVDLCVVVPEILIFGVGETGDDIAEICWDCLPDASLGTLVEGSKLSYEKATPTFGAPKPFGSAKVDGIYDSGTTTAHTEGSSAGDTATLPVYLFSNHGTDVTITASFKGGEDGGGASTTALENTTTAGFTIPLTEFTFGTDGTITQPAIGGTTDIAATSGIVDLDNNWTYKYTPATVPVAGKYEGRITYVAAQP